MITRFWAEIGTAILTLVFGLVIVKGSLEFGIGWDSAGPQPGAFPFYAGGSSRWRASARSSSRSASESPARRPSQRPFWMQSAASACSLSCCRSSASWCSA